MASLQEGDVDTGAENEVVVVGAEPEEVICCCCWLCNAL